MTTYYGPDGEIVQNPSDEFLISILKKDETYWKEGSGDSCLYFEDIDQRIIFFKDEPYGYFIMHHPDYLVPFNPNKNNDTVYHNVGGEPMVVSTACYLSQNEVEKIVLKFAKSGKILGIEAWEDLYEIVEHE